MLGETPDDDREPVAPDDPYQVPALEKNDEKEELEDYTQKELPKDDVEEIPEVEDPNLLTREQQRALRNAQANNKTKKADKGNGEQGEAEAAKGSGRGRGRGRGGGGRGKRKAPVVEDIPEEKAEIEGPAPSRPTRTTKATREKKAEVPAGDGEKGKGDVEAKAKRTRNTRKEANLPETVPADHSHQPAAKAKAKAKAENKRKSPPEAAATGNTRKQASKRKKGDEEKCQPVPEDQRPDLKKPLSLI